MFSYSFRKSFFFSVNRGTIIDFTELKMFVLLLQNMFRQNFPKLMSEKFIRKTVSFFFIKDVS